VKAARALQQQRERKIQNRQRVFLKFIHELLALSASQQTQKEQRDMWHSTAREMKGIDAWWKGPAPPRACKMRLLLGGIYAFLMQPASGTIFGRFALVQIIGWLATYKAVCFRLVSLYTMHSIVFERGFGKMQCAPSVCVLQ
jgi:hypothetical protein